jgi:hypothetical protein
MLVHGVVKRGGGRTVSMQYLWSGILSGEEAIKIVDFKTPNLGQLNNNSMCSTTDQQQQQQQEFTQQLTLLINDL